MLFIVFILLLVFPVVFPLACGSLKMLYCPFGTSSVHALVENRLFFSFLLHSGQLVDYLRSLFFPVDCDECCLLALRRAQFICVVGHFGWTLGLVRG